MADHLPNETTAILGSLADSTAIFEHFLRSIPADKLEIKRGDDYWSIHEHAAHLADVQPMVLERLRRIIAEDTPEFVPFIPENDDTNDIVELPAVDEIIEQFTSFRNRQLEQLGTAGSEDWNRKAVHPEYDKYGLLILARHILMHDHWHMYRMEELWLTRDEYLTQLEG